MANAGEEQGKETEKRMEDEDRDTSESDMDIKVERNHSKIMQIKFIKW